MLSWQCFAEQSTEPKLWTRQGGGGVCAGASISRWLGFWQKLPSAWCKTFLLRILGLWSESWRLHIFSFQIELVLSWKTFAHREPSVAAAGIFFFRLPSVQKTAKLWLYESGPGKLSVASPFSTLIGSWWLLCYLEPHTNSSRCASLYILSKLFELLRLPASIGGMPSLQTTFWIELG